MPFLKKTRLYQDYLDTRSTPQEDMLYWFIQRKMSWGARWGLVAVLLLAQHLFFLWVRPKHIAWLLWIGTALLVFYTAGQAYFWLKDRKKRPR